MIKNPKIGQTVYYLYGREVFEDKVLAVYPNSVQLNSFLYSDKQFLFKTEKLAIQYVLKIYNKEILDLSKKREKLASRLAEILD